MYLIEVDVYCYLIKKLILKDTLTAPFILRDKAQQKKIRTLFTNQKSENHHNKQNQRKISSICLTLLTGKIKEIDQKDKAIEKNKKNSYTFECTLSALPLGS